MSKQTVLIAFVAVATMADLVACGVPEADYDKIATELLQANRNKFACTDELGKNKDQLARLQEEVAMLTKENVSLKARLAPKKPVAEKT
jgi:regulator of replication initiation timing